MSIISSAVKSYIAGFLDADGCIMFQLIRRLDYHYGFQIRASTVFYQKACNRKHLEWFKTILNVGTIRDRNDGMSEYAIIGLDSVMMILALLKPYIILKKSQVNLAEKIYNLLLSDQVDINRFVKACELVDQFAQLNYSRKRTNTSVLVKEYLRHHKLYPCND